MWRGKMDEAAKRNLERIKLQIKGAWIAGIGRVDMENIDHVILATYLVAKNESRESHHEELMNVIGMF